MTAEVAILNREAVAIAADSAVTLTGPEGRKIYNTANKLFALSETEPIVVMVYGAGSFGPVPWETVVKEYRRQLASKSCGTVEEYASDFIHHLPLYVELEEQYSRVLETAMWEIVSIRESVKVLLLEKSISAQRLGKSVICGEIIAQMEARMNELRSDETIEKLSEMAAGKQINSAIPDWDTFVRECLDGLPSNGRIIKQAKAMVRASLKVASPFSSGVVVAGFGDNQLFPSLFNYVVDGVTKGKVRARLLGSAQIGERDQAGEESSAIILPFGQGDMVETFMGGIHPGYRLVLEDFVDKMIRLLTEYFGNQIKNTIPTSKYSDLLDGMSNMRSDIIKNFQDWLGHYLSDQYSDPIMQIVEWLPKEELAEMAEALVNLTSFRRRITPEDETVGGPIDVAVISKGDGLIWIKRKHYFMPELNLRYLNKPDLVSIQKEER